LIKTKPIGFWNFKDKQVLTYSRCLNDRLLDTFSRPWTVYKNEKEGTIKDFEIDFKQLT
jgi:hypothetical protein